MQPHVLFIYSQLVMQILWYFCTESRGVTLFANITHRPIFVKHFWVDLSHLHKFVNIASHIVISGHSAIHLYERPRGRRSRRTHRNSLLYVAANCCAPR